MEIKNDISIVITQDPIEGCLVYIEQIPQISASGPTVAEANAKLLAELRLYERNNYSSYNIVEYKYAASLYYWATCICILLKICPGFYGSAQETSVRLCCISLVLDWILIQLHIFIKMPAPGQNF